MKLTGKQAHVLSNLDRVRPRHGRLDRPELRPRYELDGWECTPQIVGLIVRNCVTRQPNGDLARIR